MKSLDIYLAFCFFMVFGALLEYSTVSNMYKRIKLNQRRFQDFKKKVRQVSLTLMCVLISRQAVEMKDDMLKQREQEMQLVTIEDEKKKWNAKQAEHRLLKEEKPTPVPYMEFGELPATLFGCRASDIERYARIVFPLFFFTFHMVYWTILVHISENTVEDLIPLKIKEVENINH